MPTSALQPADTKIRFGTHQQFFVVSCEVDRTSLAHIQIEMHVSDEGLNNFSTQFLTLAYGLGVASECGVTDLLDMPEDRPEDICIGINRRYDNAGSMGIYTYTFEGLLSERSDFFEYELEFSMNQEPIETHPAFEVFEPKFGPYDPLNRIWPRVPTAKQAQAGGLPGSGGSASQRVTNPMFGTTSFLSPGAVFRVTYTDTAIDEEFFQGVGTIDEPGQLREAFPDFASQLDQDRRNWLKMAPKFRKRGGAFTIIQEWLLSGPRGWMEDIYSDDAIYHSPGSGANFEAGGGSSPTGGIRSTGRGPFGGFGP